MMRKFLFFCLLLPCLALTEENQNQKQDQHLFAGKHFLASYLNCNQEALANVEKLLDTLDQAVAASGANTLQRATHIFPPSGLTAVYLLSESHASIHTYPEVGACFVDLFTCGDHCSSASFDQILREYLQPEKVNARQFLRHETIEDVP
jgi:S-adenosylmethionine decarboxylase